MIKPENIRIVKQYDKTNAHEAKHLVGKLVLFFDGEDIDYSETGGVLAYLINIVDSEMPFTRGNFYAIGWTHIVEFEYVPDEQTDEKVKRLALEIANRRGKSIIQELPYVQQLEKQVADLKEQLLHREQSASALHYAEIEKQNAELKEKVNNMLTFDQQKIAQENLYLKMEVTHLKEKLGKATCEIVELKKQQPEIYFFGNCEQARKYEGQEVEFKGWQSEHWVKGILEKVRDEAERPFLVNDKWHAFMRPIKVEKEADKSSLAKVFDELRPILAKYEEIENTPKIPELKAAIGADLSNFTITPNKMEHSWSKPFSELQKRIEALEKK